MDVDALDVRPVVEAATDSLRNRAAEAGIDLDVHLPPTAVSARAAPMNLVPVHVDGCIHVSIVDAAAFGVPPFPAHLFPDGPGGTCASLPRNQLSVETDERTGVPVGKKEVRARHQPDDEGVGVSTFLLEAATERLIGTAPATAAGTSSGGRVRDGSLAALPRESVGWIGGREGSRVYAG